MGSTSGPLFIETLTSTYKLHEQTPWVSRRFGRVGSCHAHSAREPEPKHEGMQTIQDDNMTDYIGVILGLCRVYNRVNYWGYIGIMENKMETTRDYRGYISDKARIDMILKIRLRIMAVIVQF